MKSAFLLICWLVVTFVTIGAESNGQGPATPASLVAKTIAWQAHWDNSAGMPTKIPSTVTFKLHEQSDAWITNLDWVITFVYQDNQPFPHFVQRLSLPPNEVRQRAIQPFAGLAATTIKVPAYTNSFHKITTFKPDVQQKLLAAFKHEACSTETLTYYKDDTGAPVKQVRFWIAPVDLDFPVMLYVVEGVQYVGRVNFDTHSLKPLYSDFDYIGDKDTEPHAQGLKLINAIKAEGTGFELKNGQLVPVVR